MDSSVTLVPNQGHAIGSDSAPLEVVEFADFECPACGSFATLAEPDVRARLVNTGKIRFRFIDFPLTIHRNTRTAHGAAWCAGEQGKFWEMHDLIFQNQDRWNGEATRNPTSALANLARQLGLNMAQYDSCMSTGKYNGQIQANVDEGIRRQIQSTPTFIIGPRKIANALPYDAFKRQVDEVLAEKRNAAK
jgi:protein-disulfide isomerase